ncbi:MAG: hypothetical protein ACRCXZ_01855, partial [Patescibacteria group bacterium]
QSIVLLQGDFDAWSSIPKYLMNTEIKVYVSNCFWDNALIQSSLINFSLRAGQIGWLTKSPTNSNLSIKNFFHPLLVGPNFHTSVQKENSWFAKVNL